MKGAVEPISALMITLIMLGIVASVYFWGIPLINKRQDVTNLRASENMMKSLDAAVKNVANAGGREVVQISAPGTLRFDGSKLLFEIKTGGTIYATEADIPLNEHGCSDTSRVLGKDSSESLCVRSSSLGTSGPYENLYTLDYVPLEKGRLSTYSISLAGTEQVGAQNRRVLIERSSLDEQGTNVIARVGIRIE